MPQTSAHAPSGVVSTLQGRANVIRAGKEAPQALNVGDAISPGDVILAAADTRIEVSNGAGAGWLPQDLTVAQASVPSRGPMSSGAFGRSSTTGNTAAKTAAEQGLDDVLSAVNRGDADAATAAGLGGGGDAALSGGLRVDRVIEVVTPQAFSASTERESVQGLVQTTVPQASVPATNAPKDTATAANQAPTVGNYRQVTKEDQSVEGRVEGSDANGDSLSYGKASDPQNGQVVVNADGSYTYVPNPDYHGADSFTVLVSDGKGGSALSTVNIDVTPANDPPKFEDPKDGVNNIDPNTGNFKATTDEDKPVSGKVAASDTDGDALTFAKGSDPKNGTVTVDAKGNWTYTPNKDYNGSDSFTITVSDGKGGTATATVDIGVTPANDPPKFEDPKDGTNNLDPVTGNYKATTDEDKPVSGKVAASDTDGDALSFAKATDPKNGTVTIDAQGNWTYTPNKDYNGSDSFTITVSDGKGGTATATVDIGITPVNDTPLVTQATATVSEEGLAGANADNTGVSDKTNAREATGQVTVKDVDSTKLSLTLSGPSGLTSGGKDITWSGDGSQSNPLVGTASGKTVLTASIDNTGAYKVTLQAPIDHAEAGEDVRNIALTVKASDGQSVGTGTLTLQVEDDAPLSGTQTVQVNATTSAQNTNLMLIIDTSGSMEARLNDKTAGGIKAAIKGLVDQYDGLGDVKVQIVTFSDKGAGQKLWMNVSDAKTLIDKLTANGGTNYDAALAEAQKAFAYDGKIVGGVNVSYFVTDGQPSKGKDLGVSDEAKWESFLTTNAIDSYAIGTGTLTAQYVANIEPIAYNGITGKEQPAVTLGTNAELSKYLLDTVPVVKTGTLATLAGADGLQKIESFSAAGQLGSNLDSKTQILTIQLKSGGEMKVNMVTGDFTLTQPKGAATESFSYSLLDKDGDRGAGTVSLAAGGNRAPQGTEGSITLQEDGSHSFKASDFGFRDQDAGDSLRAVRIDSLPADGKLTLNGVAVAHGQIIASGDIGKLVFSPEANANGTNYAQVRFSVQDSQGAFDATPRNLQINVSPVNDAPEVFANQKGCNVLGLVDLSVDPLLSLLKTQTFAVNDVDNNLTTVQIRVTELISLGKLLGGHDALTVSTDASLTQGLRITGNGTGDLVITSATNGGTLDVAQVNKLLGTLRLDQADVLGIHADVLPFITITATDAGNLSASQTVHTSLLSVGVDVQPALALGESLLSGHGTHSGDCGTDVFQWTLADRPAGGAHCVDTIHGFDGATRTAGGDVLDLRDLLSGEHASAGKGQVDIGNLLNHLDFDTQSQPGSTVIHISATGNFSADAGGNSHSAGCADQQQIVLSGVDIRSSLGLDAQANDHQIIAELMQRGKLLVDHG